MKKLLLACALLAAAGMAAAAAFAERSHDVSLQAPVASQGAQTLDMAGTAPAAQFCQAEQVGAGLVAQAIQVELTAHVEHAAGSRAVGTGSGDMHAASVAIPSWPPSERIRTRDEPTHRVSGLNSISLASQHARTAPAWRPSS